MNASVLEARRSAADAAAKPQGGSTAFAPCNFERKETKYLLTPEQYRQFRELVGGLLADDEYPRSIISSLYYDTPEDRLINRSMEKPRYKEKLRIRAYGCANASQPVYVELKKKFKGIVYKRRVAMSMPAAYAFMDGMPYREVVERFPLADPAMQADAFSFKSMQIASEIAFTRDRYPDLRPAMMIVTNRLALRSTEGSDVRVTFDLNPVWRDTELGFGYGFDGTPIHADGRVIMEIKCLGAYPLWLVDALSQCKVYPQSSSKYGKAYCAAHPAQPPAAALAAHGFRVKHAAKRGAARTLFHFAAKRKTA